MGDISTTSTGGLMPLRAFLAWANIGPTKGYEIINSGEVEAVKVGRLTMIRRDSAERWAASLPAFKPKAA
jgi:hypothetical protein